VNGEVARAVDVKGRQGAYLLNETVKLEGSGWVAARAMGPPNRAVADDYAFAQTSAVYVVRDGRPFVSAKDAQFLDDMLTALWQRMSTRRFVSNAEKEKVQAAVEAAHKVYRERARQQ
jgi:hypothetical protein